MNIQRKNSAHHFLMQSEREQTLMHVNHSKGIMQHPFLYFNHLKHPKR